MVKVATLRPNMVDEYERLHREIPQQNVRHISEAGTLALRIYRHGLTLVMVVEHDDALAVPDRVVDEAAERLWHQLTGACFATFWEDAPEIFAFEHKHEAT